MHIKSNDADNYGEPVKSSVRSEYMVQLDALRAIAVFAVMVSHFYFGKGGAAGVQLFFVLSGFLITGILLKCRDIGDTWKKGKHQLKQFYIRRALRIFPLFYLVIFLTATANIHPVRETLLWHLTYTSNIYLALYGWNGPINHLWSLAVEEQFYLFWAWLILFLPERYLLRCIITAIVLAPLAKIGGYFLGLNTVGVSIMTIACLDSLGIGALLAFYRYKKPLLFERLTNHQSYNLAGLVLLLVSMAISFSNPVNFFADIANFLISAMFFAWLIHKASIGFQGATGRLLEAKPLLFCGKISYGLYIYHLFMPVILPKIFQRLHIPYPEEIVLWFILQVAATIIVAACSWFLFERPINNLKRRFDYSIS